MKKYLCWEKAYDDEKFAFEIEALDEGDAAEEYCKVLAEDNSGDICDHEIMVKEVESGTITHVHVDVDWDYKFYSYAKK